MSSRRVTVFGGTGFLGRRIVRHLQDADFAVCIASRHPDRDRSLFSRDVSGIVSFRVEEPKRQSRPDNAFSMMASALVNLFLHIFAEEQLRRFREQPRPSAGLP